MAGSFPEDKKPEQYRNRIPERLKRMAAEGIKSHTTKLYGQFAKGFDPLLAQYILRISDNCTPEMLTLIKDHSLRLQQVGGPGVQQEARDAIKRFPAFVIEMRDLCKRQHYRLSVKFIVDGEEVRI